MEEGAGEDRSPDSVRAEIEAALLEEETTIADIWRRTLEGQSADQIRIARGNERPNFVWNYLRMGRAIIEGDLPTAPSVALQCSRALRRFMRDHSFTASTRGVLEDRLRVLETRAADPGALALEDREAIQATAQAETEAIPGIYVYALPHYLRHPYDESGRTLLKVGRADRDVIRRFREQTRTTALPEDPVLLRVYPCEQGASTELEGRFHRLLEAADHDRSTARTGGTEWFLTSTKFLDQIAMTLGLAIRDVATLGDVEVSQRPA